MRRRATEQQHAPAASAPPIPHYTATMSHFPSPPVRDQSPRHEWERHTISLLTEGLSDSEEDNPDKKNINSQDERVSLRVEGDRVPERLQLAADEAARSGDLRTTIEYASGARHTIQLWNEFRIWDPGD